MARQTMMTRHVLSVCGSAWHRTSRNGCGPGCRRRVLFHWPWFCLSMPAMTARTRWLYWGGCSVRRCNRAWHRNGGVLSLPDDRGLFLAHHVFRESGQVALELLLPWCQLDRLSVAGGKFCSKGCHPLHGQRLYALNLSCDGRNAFSLEHGHGVPDSRQSTRLMLDLVGEEGLLELALGATNRGTPGWWVWLLQALQLCPALAMRLRQDPRVRDISVQPLPGAGVPLMAMLGRLWQPFEPLSCADQQQAFLQEIVCETRDRFPDTCVALVPCPAADGG